MKCNEVFDAISRDSVIVRMCTICVASEPPRRAARARGDAL